MDRGHWPFAVLAGMAVALLAWLVLLPWDLSEVTADGRPIEGGGDDVGAQLALVAVIVVALGMAVVARPSTRAVAPAFVAGGLWTWTVLFAWRAGAAKTDGANLFLAPLVVVCVPVAVVAPLVVRAIARRADGRPLRPPS